MSDALFRKPGEVPAPAKPKGDENLPEPLKGKTPAEMFEIMKAEHIREMAEQNQDYTKKLEALALNPPAMPQAPAQPQFQPPAQPAEQVPSYDQDPQAYLNHQVDQRLRPIVQSMVSSARAAGKELAEQKFKDDPIFTKYRDDIEKFVDSVSPQMQSQPGIYQIARDFVRSQHVDELVEERTKSNLKDAVRATLGELGVDTSDLDARLTAREQPAPERPSLFGHRAVAPVSTPRSASAANGGPAKGRLSRAEKEMCEKFNMTEEEYITYKAENSDILSTMGRGE